MNKFFIPGLMTLIILSLATCEQKPQNVKPTFKPVTRDLVLDSVLRRADFITIKIGNNDDPINEVVLYLQLVLLADQHGLSLTSATYDSLHVVTRRATELIDRGSLKLDKYNRNHYIKMIDSLSTEIDNLRRQRKGKLAKA